MRDTDLYQRILNVQAPWAVVDVHLDSAGKEVRVVLAHGESDLACPTCGSPGPRYDGRYRRWRHLDTCQFRTIIEADVPRVKCKEHGVLQVRVPWGEPGSRFTALYEALVIDWLQEASIAAVARLLGLSWDEVDGIMARAVGRGLSRRKTYLPNHLGVDETSFQRRHEYVTVAIDLDQGTAAHVGDGRGRAVLDDYFGSFSEAERGAVEWIATDMWEGYIRPVLDHIPDGDQKIAFDKFHVAKHLGEAVDKVRRRENRALLARGVDALKGSKYLWLSNPDSLEEERWNVLQSLCSGPFKTARAWAIKEAAMSPCWRL
jgi:transposase